MYSLIDIYSIKSNKIMEIQFTSNSSHYVLHTIYNAQHVPSKGDGIYLPDGKYYTLEERDFHYDDNGSFDVCLWIVESL